MPRVPLPSRRYSPPASSARAAGLWKEKQFSSSTSDARALETSGGCGGGALAGCGVQGPSAEPPAEGPEDAPQPMRALCNYCGG